MLNYFSRLFLVQFGLYLDGYCSKEIEEVSVVCILKHTFQVQLLFCHKDVQTRTSQYLIS